MIWDINISQTTKSICNSQWGLPQCAIAAAVWMCVGHLLHALPPCFALQQLIQWQSLTAASSRVSWRINSCSMRRRRLGPLNVHIFIYSILCYLVWQTFGANVVPCGSSHYVTEEGSSCACEYPRCCVLDKFSTQKMDCGITSRRQGFPRGEWRSLNYTWKYRLLCSPIHLVLCCEKYFFLHDLWSGRDSEVEVHNI